MNNPAPIACYDGLTREELIMLLHQKDELLQQRDESMIKKDELLKGYERELTESAATMKELKRILALRNKKLFSSTSEKGIPGKTDGAASSDYIPYEEVPKGSVQEQAPQPTPEEGASTTAVAVTPAPAKPPSPRVYKKPHPGRYRIPDHIPREEHHIYPEDYDNSWDNRELPPERTERLSLRIELIAEVTIRHKYARKTGIVMAPYPLEDPFYKYKATCQLVAQMLWLRFAMHMPYYRFWQMVGQDTVSYATLMGWCSRGFDMLACLRPLLHQEILKDAKLLSMDETTFKLLDTPGHIEAFRENLKKREEEMLKRSGQVKGIAKNKNRKACDNQDDDEDDDMDPELKGGIKKGKIVIRGQMWVLLNAIKGLVLFEYSPSRETINARLLLEGFAGLLLSDAYTAYKGATRHAKGIITLLNCWSHARRLFLEAYDLDNPDPVNLKVLLMIARLYEIEVEIKDRPPRKRKQIRKRSAALLRRMKRYLQTKLLEYAPKEPMAKAIGYVLNQWEPLTNYVRYGIAPIDNNATYPNFLIIQTSAVNHTSSTACV